MEHINFKPWIGSKYATTNAFGKRILVLGESHYGNPYAATTDFTSDVVREYGQRTRYAFFTKVAKVLLQKDKSAWLSDVQRSEVWEHVAFYNYIQELVGDYSRQRPTYEMWLAAERPFLEVIAQLRPHLVLVLGTELARWIPALPAEITVCTIQHPSTGFDYTIWNPRFADAMSGLSA